MTMCQINSVTASCNKHHVHAIITVQHIALLSLYNYADYYYFCLVKRESVISAIYSGTERINEKNPGQES